MSETDREEGIRRAQDAAMDIKGRELHAVSKAAFFSGCFRLDNMSVMHA